jgi:hypothetical protein
LAYLYHLKAVRGYLIIRKQEPKAERYRIGVRPAQQSHSGGHDIGNANTICHSRESGSL